MIVRIVLPRGFFLYHTIDNATQNQQFFVPGNIPTFSGLLGLTIIEMGMNFAFKMLFFSGFQSLFSFFRTLNQARPSSAVVARRTLVRDGYVAHVKGEPSSKLGSIPRMDGHLFGTGTTDLRIGPGAAVS